MSKQTYIHKCVICGKTITSDHEWLNNWIYIEIDKTDIYDYCSDHSTTEILNSIINYTKTNSKQMNPITDTYGRTF